MIVLSYIFYFLLWTLTLYIIHRVVHNTQYLKTFHYDHHVYVLKNNTGWQWNNLLLFNDTWKSTVDLWITEVIPTIIFSWVTGQWWISVFYYLWAALFQENLEHNRKINYYPITCGRWHLKHHERPDVNFGLFIPIWDKLFKTEQQVQ